MIQRNKEAKGYFQETRLDAQSSAAAHNRYYTITGKWGEKNPLPSNICLIMRKFVNYTVITSGYSHFNDILTVNLNKNMTYYHTM